MGYNLAFAYVNCWACGKRPLTQTLSMLARIPYDQARKLLGDVDRERSRRRDIVRGRLELPPGVEPLADAHRDYLTGRGFDPDHLAEFWGVAGIGNAAGPLRWRLFIPVVHQGEVVSWTTRSISRRPGGRYRSAKASQESIPHKSILYGEDHCGHSVIVHEGPFDVWRTGPGSVCTFGTDFTQAQVLRLSRYARRVICFDNNPEGQRQAVALCDALSAFGPTDNVILTAKDAAEASRSEIRQLRALIA